MKSMFAKGAFALIMAVSASAADSVALPTAEAVKGDANHQTIMKNMQDKVAQDINAIIAKYDYKLAYEKAQKEF